MNQLEVQIEAINKFIKDNGRNQHVLPWQLEKLKMWQEIQDHVEKDGLTIHQVFKLRLIDKYLDFPLT